MKTYTETSKEGISAILSDNNTLNTYLKSLKSKRFTEVHRGQISIIASVKKELDNYIKSLLENSDYIQISLLYKEVINRFKEINREFGFNHPLEIFATYTYLLKKGYLSRNKHFEYSQEQIVDDFIPIAGINVIAGQGVCRHTAQMLDSIYKSMDIRSTQLSAKQFSAFSKEENTKEEKETISKDDDDIHKYTAENLSRYLKLLLICLKEDISHTFKDVKPNHVINCAVYEGRDYYLDPTNYCILNKVPRKNNILIDIDCSLTQITRGNHFFYNNYQNRKIINTSLTSRDSSLSQEMSLITNATQVCKENEDVFERFYENNSSIYDEIGSILLS